MAERLRVGIIGAGSWANAVHLPTLAAMSDVELVVVVRRDGDLARQIAERFGVRHALTDWRAALALGLDAVIVATPPNVHEEQVTAALASGAHVLCEKPFAIAPDAAWRMVEAARKHERHLLIAFGWNYMPLMQAARRLIDEHGIGEIDFLTLDLRVAIRQLLSRGTAYVGTGDMPPRAETFVDPAVSGGGQAPVSMSHAFGLALFLARLEAQEIYARMVEGPAGVDIHDAMIVTFANGAIGSISGSVSHEARPTPEWRVGVFGTKAQLYVDSAFAAVEMATSDGRRIPATLPRDAGHHEPSGPTRELIAVAHGKVPGDESPAELGARTIELVDAAYRSSQSGRTEAVASAARPPWIGRLT